MKPLRRLQLALCCLLAVLLGSGAVLPSPAVWQCRYSSHVISAAFTPAPNAMPCLMGHSTVDSTMPPMPCCHLAKSTAHRSSHGELTLLSPPCHPTLTSLAAVPALGMMGANLHLRQSPCRPAGCTPLDSGFRCFCSLHAVSSAETTANGRFASLCPCLLVRSSCASVCLDLLCAWSVFADPAASHLYDSLLSVPASSLA